MAISISLVGFGRDLEAARAYRALGATSTRIEILRLILAAERVSTTDVMQSFGLTRNGVLHHLKSLERENVIRVHHETHPRGAGPITYWSADAAEVDALLDCLHDHLMSTARTPGIRSR